MPEYVTHHNGSQLILDLNGSGWRQHIACCECGLDHLFVFELVKGNKVMVTVYRDDERTIQLRKKERFPCRAKSNRK
jgi:hypothetical protein